MLVVPSDVTARVQEMHILLGQMLCEAIEVVKFAPSCFRKEIADKQSHQELRDPFSPVNRLKDAFEPLTDFHWLITPWRGPEQL